MVLDNDYMDIYNIDNKNKNKKEGVGSYDIWLYENLNNEGITNNR